MKRTIMLMGIIICLAATFCMPALAASGDVEAFGEAFRESLNPNPGSPFGLRELVYLDGVFYGYIGDSIYTWAPSDAQPMPYCTIPTVPEWKEEWRTMSFGDLSAEDEAALTEAVDYIAVGDGALWGYNILSGKIGEITEQGITWMNQELDTSFVYKGDSILPLFLPIQSFVMDGKLYVFGDNVRHIEPLSEPEALICFDLSSGAYEIIDTKTALNCYPYKSGKLLLLRRGDSSSMILSVMDLQTGTLEDLPASVPFPDRSNEGLETVGGLAYDEQNDQTFFSIQKQVWRSKGGEPFESIAELDDQGSYRTLAWVLDDGRYAILHWSLLIFKAN
ncbi:MAG: hypothetical protein GX096_08880 [Clostridiales bacterium]|nr:hypothetical protein [Clostridiales bacterium]